MEMQMVVEVLALEAQVLKEGLQMLMSEVQVNF